MTAARCPTDSLPALGAFRADAAVRVHVQGERCWVRWPAGRTDVVAALRPVPGVEFYECRPPHWHRAGERLPSNASPPDGDGEALARLLYPAPFPIADPPTNGFTKLPIALERGGPPRPATALLTSLDALAAWGDAATTAELRATRAAVAGERAFVLAATPPTIPGADRFWGDGIFAPVGFHVAPHLPAALLRETVGAEADDLVFVHPAGLDVVPAAAFEPLTRAGLRGAARP